MRPYRDRRARPSDDYSAPAPVLPPPFNAPLPAGYASPYRGLPIAEPLPPLSRANVDDELESDPDESVALDPALARHDRPNQRPTLASDAHVNALPPAPPGFAWTLVPLAPPPAPFAAPAASRYAPPAGTPPPHARGWPAASMSGSPSSPAFCSPASSPEAPAPEHARRPAMVAPSVRALSLWAAKIAHAVANEDRRSPRAWLDLVAALEPFLRVRCAHLYGRLATDAELRAVIAAAVPDAWPMSR